MAETNGSLRSERYQIERLDDVRDRVSNIEGRLEELIKTLATKEDVANAKLAMFIAYIGIGMSLLIGIGSIVVRLWLG